MKYHTIVPFIHICHLSSLLQLQVLEVRLLQEMQVVMLPPAPQQVVVPSAPAAATLTIPVGASTAGNPSYDPVSLTVKKGDEIDVVNKDSSPHTVTSGKTPDAPDAGKQFDTSIINAAASARLMTANLQAGEYDFHCAVHPFMMGKIIVQ